MSEKMMGPIAICTVGELFGGVERHVLGLIEGLRSQGIDTVLVVFHDNELARQARSIGVDPIILPAGNAAMLAATMQFAALLESRDIRIVHAHGYKAVVFCALTRLRHRFFLVRTEHGLPESNAAKPWQTFKGAAYHWMENRAVALSQAYTCCVTADLMRRHGPSARPPTLIPNGIPTLEREEFARPSELQRDRFNIAAVGRLDRVKGFDLAINALALPEVPREVYLNIVGAGPCLDELRTQARNAGVSDRVNFLGFRRDVFNIIAHCDVLMMPSLHEGLPYTLLEAMALATPVLASNVGGLAETLEHERTALLVPPRNPQAIAHAINRLHADPSLRQRLGSTAREIQKARYSLDAMTAGYLELYRGLLSEHAHS